MDGCIILSLLIIAGVAYASFAEGIFGAWCSVVMVVLSGVISFSFFEPVARILEPMFRGSVLGGYEDGVGLVAVFCASYGLLRTILNSVSARRFEYHALVDQIGGGAIGVLVGYLLSGFIICVLQTLPWEENFWGFRPVSLETETASGRKYFPPDRVWLNLVTRSTSPSGFMGGTVMPFDPDGSFEVRYLRHRRFTEDREPLPYAGEIYELSPAAPPEEVETPTKK